MEEHVKLFPSLTNLRRESDDIATIPSFTILEEKSHFLLNIIQNLENKPLNEVINFIQRYHTSFLNFRLFTESSSSRSTMQRLFTSVFFLDALYNCIGSLQLEQNEKLFLNKITYDYMTIPDKNVDVCNRLLQISGYINNTLTIKLSSKLGVNEAKTLAVISNSTTDQEIRVHRINRFLVNCDNPVLDKQGIIDIMFFLYDHFMYPIIYTLLETESCCKSEEVKPQYHKLIDSIIVILLSMPTEKMVKVLTEYGYIVNSKGLICPVKLKSINDDRLKAAIQIVEQDPLIKEIK